jgi:hypothetical protein
MGGLGNGPSGFDEMEETGARHFTEDAAGIARQSTGQLGPPLSLERSSGFQVIRTVEYPPYHVPLRQSYGVIPHRVEYAAVPFAFGPRSGGAGGAVAQFRWSGRMLARWSGRINGPPG